MYSLSVLFIALSLVLSAQAQTYSATYLPSNAPNQTEQGQAGTNQCGTTNSQTSQCQNAYLNSVDDFCLFAPPEPGPGSVIGNTERFEVAWCLKAGTGSRLIPDGSITGAHFVQTPDFVQITGVGNLTQLNIPAGDEGGELDPHGADGNGNPIGGLVFSSAFGQLEQLHEWTNFMSATEFCFRACKPGPMAPTWCEHIYDVMGCDWNMPANYSPDVFERCQGDSGEPMGVYGSSTFHQGDPVTPDAHPIPSSSQCTTLSTIGNGLAVSTTGTASSTSPASSSTVSVTSIFTSASTSTSTSLSGSGSGMSTLPSSSSQGSGSSSAASRSVASSSSSATSPSSNAAVSGASLPGWERLVATIGFGLIGSALGAIMIL